MTAKLRAPAAHCYSSYSHVVGSGELAHGSSQIRGFEALNHDRGQDWLWKMVWITPNSPRKHWGRWKVDIASVNAILPKCYQIWSNPVRIGQKAGFEISGCRSFCEAGSVSRACKWTTNVFSWFSCNPARFWCHTSLLTGWSYNQNEVDFEVNCGSEMDHNGRLCPSWCIPSFRELSNVLITNNLAQIFSRTNESS